MTAKSGKLYVVATPIGNLMDISSRAIEILHNVDLIAVEDTRHTGKLLSHFAIETPMLAYYDHNEELCCRKLMDSLLLGKNIALVSDAGTPLISDPGFALVQEARSRQIEVIPIPGPCALVAALSVAGLPSDKFAFEGFLPAKSAARKKRLQLLVNEYRTLIFYEAPHRIQSCIADMLACFGAQREAVIARELTKNYETIYKGALSDIANWLELDANQRRGEFVLLVHGTKPSELLAEDEEAIRILRILLTELSHKQAVAMTAKITGLKKNYVYRLALNLNND